MRRLGWPALAATALALSACGSKASSASSPSAATTAPVVRTAPPATAGDASPAAPTTSSPSSGAAEASGTRTAPEPAFANKPSTVAGVGAAEATVRAHGYTPVNTSDYHPTQTLRVLIGTRAGASGAYSHRAFFFVDGHYIGTDASDASAALSVVSQADTEVTLAYPLYRLSDPECCPGGGQARVRFQLNNGKLTALDPIPPVHSAVRLSRR